MNVYDLNKEYEITDEERKRLNILRFILSIMVIFIHVYSDVSSYYGNSNLILINIFENIRFFISKIFSRIAVPGFFLISSILLYRKEFNYFKNLKKKIFSILIPYIIFNSFWILFYYVVQKVPMLSVYFSSSNKNNVIAEWKFLNYIDAYIGFENGSPILYPLWFLRDLFFLNVLAIIFKKIISIKPQFFAVLFIFGWLNIETTGVFCLNIEAICFWGLGCCMVLSNLKLHMIDKSFKNVTAILYCFLVLLIFGFKDTDYYFLLNRLTILVGLCFVYIYCTNVEWMKNNDKIIKITKYSFGIYLFHEMSLTILRKCFWVLVPHTLFFCLVEYIVLPIFVLVIALSINIFLERVMPKTYSLITGNRIK